jgi:Fur family ferric uptake transcriptional regulator
LAKEGLKATRQRNLIVQVFARSSGHVSVDELLRRVNRRDASIGYATVYRTVKLLVQAGLASARHFGDGFARFEVKEEQHHDHMICEECGAILEFTDGEIERLQENVARRHGFQIHRHRLELYGLCSRCQKAE